MVRIVVVSEITICFKSSTTSTNDLKESAGKFLCVAGKALEHYLMSSNQAAQFANDQNLLLQLSTPERKRTVSLMTEVRNAQLKRQALKELALLQAESAESPTDSDNSNETI
jgi:hypothetical protein